MRCIPLFSLVLTLLCARVSAEVVLEQPLGLRLIGNTAKVTDQLPCPSDLCCESVYLNEVDIASRDPLFLRRLHLDCTTQPLTLEKLEEIRFTIIRYYLSCGYPFVQVSIPEQDVSSGYVQILVSESKLGTLTAQGCCFFDECRLKNGVGVGEGEPIYLPSLLNDLAWLNRNPFRRSDVVFTPGVIPGTTDLILQTQDRCPWLVYSSIENTGTRQTGSERLSLGFKYGNMWNRDHVLTYQFTSAASLKKFQSHNLDYLIPLPWKHILDIYGSYSLTHPNFDRHIKCEGISWQLCGRYEIPVNLRSESLEDFVFGFDFKRTNNNLSFGGETIIHHLVDIVQLMAGWNMGRVDVCNSFYLNVEGYFSPGNITSNNTTEEFNKLQKGAKCHYAYAWMNLGYSKTFHNAWSASIDVTGQGATENLLPSEQMELAGYFAVRGYPEHEINVDNGVYLNLELHTPDLSFCSSWNDRLYGLVFFDYGYGTNHRIEHGFQKGYELISIGPGIRYNISTHVAFRLDYGVQLKSAYAGHRASSRVHAGLFADY